MSALAVLLPDFAIIVLGRWLARYIDNTAWRRIDWLSFYVLYPALLFAAASSRPIELGALLTLGSLAWAVLALGLVLGLSVRRLSSVSWLDFAGALQNTWRFNTALGFVAVQALPAEATAVFAVIIGMAVPLANLFAVAALARDRRLSLPSLLREIGLNPFLLASLGGVLVGLSGWMLPAMLGAFVDRLADAALALVLLSIGAALRGRKWWPPDRLSLALHSIKLLVLPASVLGVALLTHSTGTVPATLLIFAALPTASAAHVLASRYGADRQWIALIVTQSSLGGLLTLPLWTIVAEWLGQA